MADKPLGTNVTWLYSCDICGKSITLGTAHIRLIVPIEITKQARLPDSRNIALCSQCDSELSSWYAKNVSNIVYDPETKRFERKSPVKIVREYVISYQAFANYRKPILKHRKV
jgi:hypothetical protein